MDAYKLDVLLGKGRWRDGRKVKGGKREGKGKERAVVR